MDDHDTSYRLLFSHPEMVRDLLLGFVPGEWVRELDFDSLEKMNGSYVTDDLRSRHADTIWRVRWGEDWLYADSALLALWSGWMLRPWMRCFAEPCRQVEYLAAITGLSPQWPRCFAQRGR